MREPSEVDVVILTKNSEHLLAKCLGSIYQNVPVKNLIIIDGYSTDTTLKILEQFNRKHHNIQIHQLNGSRAKARTEGIRKVTTDWFLFVDSDVVLCRDWFRKATGDLAEGVGAVWGLNVDLLPNVKNGRVLKLQSMVARQCFKLRGGMHDTLILRKAVEGIVIPEALHAYEDAYLVQWIEEHGYRAVIGSGIYCLHCKPPENWNLKNGVEQAIVELRCGLLYSHIFEYMVFYPVFFLYWGLQLPLNGFRNGSSR
ncbi:MAG: glycosyltransferase family 2 protein [Candidatus Bathyarchaeota archaeon]|nr:glycosyltransferase family 2 protein [Candidatus Bathyarchaeota archaeon]